MTFDNSKTIINLRIKFFWSNNYYYWLIIALAYVAKLIKFPFLGLSDTFWTLFLVGIWFLLRLCLCS